MSNTDPKLTKKEKKGVAARAEAEEGAEEAKPGFVSYLAGGALGLVLLVVLWQGFSPPPQAKTYELSHLVVLAKYSDLADATVRQDLARLQTALAKICDPAPEILGPLSAPWLLPGEQPRAVALDRLSAEEFATALPYVKGHPWWSPRIFGAEMTTACFRVGPKGARFPASARAEVERVLAEFEKSSLELAAYSHDLRLTEPADQAAINAEFGVQTANALATLPAGKSCLDDPSSLFKLRGALQALEQPDLRARVCLADFYSYALRVMTSSPKAEVESIGEQQRLTLLALVKTAGAASYVSDDGSRTLIYVTTAAEDEANLDMAHFVAANARKGGFSIHALR